MMQPISLDFCSSSLRCLASGARVLQEAARSSGSLDAINFMITGSKMSLKCGLVHLAKMAGMKSQILMLILHELTTDRFLNLVRHELLLTS